MKPETLELQNQIEPGCGQVVEKITFPIAVDIATGMFKYLVLSENKEIQISNWYGVRATGLDRLDRGSGIEIPTSVLIAELKAIIAELEN